MGSVKSNYAHAILTAATKTHYYTTLIEGSRTIQGDILIKLSTLNEVAFGIYGYFRIRVAYQPFHKGQPYSNAYLFDCCLVSIGKPQVEKICFEIRSVQTYGTARA